MLASLPMYPIYRDVVETLWTAVADALRAKGLMDVPATLDWPADLTAHWRRPDLLVSQTCGYPLVTELANEVRVIGAFAYTARGCEGVHYRSLVVARSADPRQALAAFRGANVAYNSVGSQSGYNALRVLLAPLAVDGRFFQRSIETGAHLASMKAVLSGTADIAAIDCVSYALFCEADPELGAWLKVVTETRSAPGLPLITRGAATDAEIADLRAAIGAVVTDPALAGVRDRLMIAGFEPIDASAYSEILAMRDEAVAAGYLILR